MKFPKSLESTTTKMTNKFTEPRKNGPSGESSGSLGIECDPQSLPDLVMTFYKRFPDRSDFFPLQLSEGRINFLVSSDEGIKKASYLAMRSSQRGLFIYVPQKEILEMSERYSHMFEEDLNLALSDESAITDDYDILSGSHNDAPVVKLVNQLIMNAIRDGASDIHIEGVGVDLIVRFRMDGQLKIVKKLNRRLLEVVIARIKVMAEMDVAETRRPQDGRINVQFGTKTVDIRVSSIPAAGGEKAALRLLSRSESILSLAAIGIEEADRAVLRKVLRSPNGIVIVTGPTGSGKTTTLYASILDIKSEAINIVTIEEPIEYRIDGIAQVQVNPPAGVTFANAIKTFLRQDPDVMLVGEIRDEETAKTAIQASLTGHLVLTTLHTNDAPTAIARLIEMEIEPFLLSSSLLLVVGQRLIRKVCDNCRVEVRLTDDMISTFEANNVAINKYFRGSGCSNCSLTGYKGRAGLFEFLFIDDKIRKLIMKKANASEVRELAIGQGMKTMFSHGAELIKRGITTPEEVFAATFY